ncbi:MAG: hypothetical protein ABIO70_33025 [Pseudomonadota bacterium]
MPSRPRFPLLLSLALLCGLAGATQAAPLLPDLPTAAPDWTWAPLDLGSDIRVAPLLVVGTPVPLQLRGYLGEELDGAAAALRNVRSAQVLAVPGAFSEALPGELASALPPEWRGHMSDAKVTPATRSQLVAGLDGRRPMEGVLLTAADRVQGEVVLFHWLVDLSAEPLATRLAPGTTQRVADRLVYVDRHTDPVLAEATVGLALVSADGEVFLRYEDRYSFVITGTNTSQRAGRDLARQLVDDLAPLLDGGSVAALRP